MADKNRILIVDDTPSNIKILNDFLKNHYHISVATDGRRALDIAASDHKPDLILLDIMMPGMDGYEVCRKLKSKPSTKEIPIIFVSAKGEVEDETKGFELGAVDYIRKPISPPLVLARVKNHVLLKDQHDQLKKSISVIRHEADLLEHKAELGIQAGGLAHDLNNILFASMHVELIEKLLPENFPEKEAVFQIIDLIKNSVSLGTEVCQGFTSYLHDIGTEAKAQPVLPLLQPIDMYAKRFKGEIIKEYSSALPLLFCKGYQIKRILVNLFTNAWQALANQEKPIIIVKVWSMDNQVHFSVKDNGPGIPSKILSKIYDERFTTKKEGTGLGLFIIKEIVDWHGGKINVDTQERKGTTFTVSLPVSEK